MAKGEVPPRRVTIADIAERAGVSKGAVSYALNDRPGLADATRERILAIAKELGWYPNSAARALSGARASACGLVLARPAKTLAFEPFFMELIAGIESELSARSIALTLQVVRDLEGEVAVYRRWWAERRVDGVLVVDLRVEDPRVDELLRLGLPAVVVGGERVRGRLPVVWHDDARVMVELVRYLSALGHRRIARVAGVPGFLHVETRTEAFTSTASELGLAVQVLTTDFLAESGARATRQLLSGPRPPTAVVYDSDVLAVAGLGVAQELGVEVPRDLSIIAWDDSPFCQVVHPALTAVFRDIPAYGAAACSRLLEVIEGVSSPDLETPRGQLLARGSTGRAPGSGRDRRAAELPRPRRSGSARRG